MGGRSWLGFAQWSIICFFLFCCCYFFFDPTCCLVLLVLLLRHLVHRHLLVVLVVGCCGFGLLHHLFVALLLLRHLLLLQGVLPMNEIWSPSVWQHRQIEKMEKTKNKTKQKYKKKWLENVFIHENKVWQSDVFYSSLLRAIYGLRIVTVD